MNQHKLIKNISFSEGIKRKKCNQIILYFWKSVSRVLIKKGNVRINSFGEFKIVRKEMKIIEGENMLYTVIPPKNSIEFEYYESSEPVEKLKDFDDIINDISIEFILSKKDSEMITYLILFSIRNYFEKKKNFDMENFGEFKVKDSKGMGEAGLINFFPAKKFSKRANSNFNNLKICKVTPVKPEALIEKEKLEFKLSDNFKKEMLSDEEEPKENQETEIIISDSEAKGMRKLISDEVVKLHKEITDAELEIQKKKNVNLWR